ncbi:hypothetical protein E2C01_002797 [Portunus trituberculatus]|uniref:Uncharacterized protein n=1 Tax=Portunus trituberculatus TaxID=210409 RepID=A0A5B7CM68_PORTR|nr:hypothetical protein [Portunus trituberculatus]
MSGEGIKESNVQMDRVSQSSQLRKADGETITFDSCLFSNAVEGGARVARGSWINQHNLWLMSSNRPNTKSNIFTRLNSIFCSSSVSVQQLSSIKTRPSGRVHLSVMRSTLSRPVLVIQNRILAPVSTSTVSDSSMPFVRAPNVSTLPRCPCSGLRSRRSG